MLIWIYTSEVKTDDRSLSVLEYKRSIYIMYRWTLVVIWKKFDMYKEILCTPKNVMGLTPWRRPIDLRKVLSGTILLSEPMDSVYKQTDENKRKKSVYVWILTKMFWICTMKFRYVHKRIGTYTVREAHDRLRNSRENEFGFIV